MAFSCFHVALIIAVFLIARGDSLSCYTCKSQKSWEDCNSKMTKTTCSGSPNCVTGKLTCTAGSNKATVYYKGCGAAGSSCGPKDDIDCPTTPSVSWSFFSSNTCCSGDNCNSGSLHGISKTMLGICMAFSLGALAVVY